MDGLDRRLWKWMVERVEEEYFLTRLFTTAFAVHKEQLSKREKKYNVIQGGG